MHSVGLGAIGDMERKPWDFSEGGRLCGERSEGWGIRDYSGGQGEAWERF